jgi:hypothetical protein
MIALLRLATMAVGAAAFLFAPAPTAPPQLQTQCKCIPEVSLDPDTTCPCPGIVITNLTTRDGKCSKVSNQCTGASTLTCRVDGTVSETGCVGGFVDQPFCFVKMCLQFDNMCDFPIDCSMTTGQHHRVLLNCKKCTDVLPPP